MNIFAFINHSLFFRLNTIIVIRSLLLFAILHITCYLSGLAFCAMSTSATPILLDARASPATQASQVAQPSSTGLDVNKWVLFN